MAITNSLFDISKTSSITKSWIIFPKICTAPNTMAKCLRFFRCFQWLLILISNITLPCVFWVLYFCISSKWHQTHYWVLYILKVLTTGNWSNMLCRAPRLFCSLAIQVLIIPDQSSIKSIYQNYESKTFHGAASCLQSGTEWKIHLFQQRPRIIFPTFPFLSKIWSRVYDCNHCPFCKPW